MLIKIMNKLGEKEIQFLPDHKKFFSKYTEYKFKHSFSILLLRKNQIRKILETYT